MVAATAAGVVVATAPKAVQKDALKAARTLDQKVVRKVVQKAKAATNGANATLKVVLKASAKTDRWVKAASLASRVNRAVKAATSHALMSTSHVPMSVWTLALKVGKKVSHAKNLVNLAPSQVVVAANVLKAVASVVSHVQKPANRVVNGSSVTPSSRTWHWPTKQPWRPR